jgi:hypothetical protein
VASAQEPVTEQPAAHEHEAVAHELPVPEAATMEESVVHKSVGEEQAAQDLMVHEPVIDQGAIVQEPVMQDSEGQEIVAEDPINHDLNQEMMAPEPIVHEPAIQESEGTDVVENALVIQDESSDPAVTASPLPDETSIVQKTALPSQPNVIERRNADWGMSIQEIKAHEPLRPAWELYPPILDDATYRIAYRTTIEGIPSSLAYTFYQEQLAQAKYVFEPQHNDPDQYVGDFHMVREWISEAYGPPSSVEEIWLDTLYRYDDSLRGQALMRGHLIMVAEWKTLETQIVLVLNGGDETVGMVADFSSSHIRLPAPQQDSGSLSATNQDSGGKESDPDSSL